MNGFRPISIPNFGGWCTLVDEDSVLVGLSPDLRDVEFVPQIVRTRPGLLRTLNLIGAASSVNGMLTSRFGGITLFFISPNGDISQELSEITSGATILTLPGPQAFPAPNVPLFMNGLYAFDRAYLSFQMDEQGLPKGALPALQYNSPSLPVDLYAIEGPYATGLPGQLLAASNVAAGSIVAGVHSVIGIFETRNGFLPAIRQPQHSSWTAAGGQRVDVTNIPIGPPGTIRRHLAFTAAGGRAFHKFTTIEDNTTTSSLAIDFTDSALLALENMDFLFEQEEVYDPMGIIQYGSRMVVWGCRDVLNGTRITPQNPSFLTSQEGFNNLGFDGGFNGTLPSGWDTTAETAGGAKESSDVVAAGEAYKITGDGATAIRGHIKHPSTEGFMFPKGKNINVKAWVKRSSGLTQGNLKIFVSGGAAAGLTVTAAQASVNYQQFVGTLWLSTETPLLNFGIHIQADGTPTSGQFFLVDRIQVFDAAQEYETSVYRVSKPDDPEAFDGVDGFLVVSPDDQQEARTAFVIRTFLYLAKEHGLHVTSDTGEVPARWPIGEISDTVGTPSVRGVGIGDEWAVIGHQSGLWYFDGGELTESHKLTKEIQPTWDSINWTFGHRLEIKVDTRRKRIYVAAPFDGATVNNRILMLDYVEGFGDPMLQRGFGRKWCPWFISCNSMEMAEQVGGKKELVVGNNANNGRAYRLDSTSLSDDEAVIQSRYQTAYLGNSVRSLFGYLHVAATGAGTLDLRVFRGNQGDLRDLRGWALDENGFHDLERQLNIVRERVAFRFGVDALNEHFSVGRLIAYMRPSTWSPVRGHNRA